MHSNDFLILAIAGVAAWYIINRAKAQAAPAASTAPPGISAESLAWYLNDIYERMNAGEYRDQAYLTDLYGRSYA